MDLIEVIKARHSVRHYKNKDIEKEKALVLKEFIDECNQESGLNFQLVLNDREAFDGSMVHYGSFDGVNSYIALIGKTTPDLEEKAGYYGEKCLIKAQELGLNSCWIALTFNKRSVMDRCKILKGEKLVSIISIGYGVDNGNAHSGKSVEVLSNVKPDSPQWFKDGVALASIAPTARNQQRFYLEYMGDGKVKLTNLGGEYSKIDLGIVKYHFEIGGGKNFTWVE